MNSSKLRTLKLLLHTAQLTTQERKGGDGLFVQACDVMIMIQVGNDDEQNFVSWSIDWHDADFYYVHLHLTRTF